MANWCFTYDAGTKQCVQEAQLLIFNSAKREENLILYKKARINYTGDFDCYDANWGPCQDPAQVEYVSIPVSVEARILYLDRINTRASNFETDRDVLHGESNVGKIRIQVLNATYDASMKDAIRITFAGETYQREGDWRKIGFVEFMLWTSDWQKVN